MELELELGIRIYLLNRYFTGHYFVDIHPPLAKLVFAWVLSLTPFKGAEEYDVSFMHSAFWNFAFIAA
jgi:dolichyl-phosphate-mannose--protein O-mannosyl transferase